MILAKAYGRSPVAATGAMLMILSMVINESLVARTFGTYALQLFGVQSDSALVPVLALGLILAGFLVNLAGNEMIGTASKVGAVLRIGGILVFAGVTLFAAGFFVQAATAEGSDPAGPGGLVAGTALAILAYKGLTTIGRSIGSR